MDAVFVGPDALGDPVVLAAGLAPTVPEDLLLGVRLTLGPRERHPALLARDLTSLDLASGGRSVLCFQPPFGESVAEAVALCRALWRKGEVAGDGRHFPVRAAANRARPAREGSPLVALDLTSGEDVPVSLEGSADLVLRPWTESGRPDACRLERV